MGTVETASGRVEGSRDGPTQRFAGIPYAAPPTGELRLRGPRPVDPWAGVRDATAFGPWPPQNPPLSELSGAAPEVIDEDCLTLNVWTPAVDGQRRPVLVWIHGGAFIGGSGAAPLYRGAPLAARGDVVVVTINYRLGILGFLADPSLSDGEAGGAAGNWGLLDQVAALRWVRDNIASFGGDPGNVTVFGESAGGMSVSDLLALPAAGGLFHKAVVQSGPPNAVSMEQAEEITAKLLADLGVGTAAGVRNVPVPALLDAQARISAQRAGGLPLAPVVDGAVLPEPPARAIADGAAADIPLIVGTNRDEWKMFIVGDPRGHAPDLDVVRRRLERTFTASGVRLAVDEVMDRYAAIRSSRGTSVDPRELWSAIESDRIFRVGSLRAAAGHAAHQPRTFSYLFTWESPALHGALGACHALEIPFVLGTLDAPGFDRFAGTGPAAESLSGQMMDAWLAFARTGDPSHAGLPAAWPGYDAGRRATMIFGADTHLEDAPLDEERLVWEGTAAV